MEPLKMAKAILPAMISDRRHIHMHPEIGMEEVQTCAYVRSRLDEMKIPWVEASPTGTVATIGSGAPVLGLRADIDALDIQENTGTEYQSCIPGKMHACGHDAHTACLLGAASILKEIEPQLKGTIKLIFQPAEESGVGAQAVVDSSAVKDCNAFFALHVASSLPTGRCSISKGVISAGNDRFVIHIHGKSCHGSSPQKGVDALMTGVALAQSMQTMITRSVDPLFPVCMNIGLFQAGTAFNILPGEAYLEGSIRFLDESLRQVCREKLRTLAEHTAAAFGAKADVEFENTAKIVINDDKLTDLAIQAVSSFLGREAVVEQGLNMGAEDFASFLSVAPGTYLNVGTGNAEKHTDNPHHNEKFDIDEDALPICCAAYVQFALNYLNEG